MLRMISKQHITIAVSFLLMFLGGAQTLIAAESRIVKAKNIGNERVDLDGILDEAVWASAEPATGFIQEDPEEGKPSTELTEVYILYNKENLYIGARLYDSDPAGILAYQKRRDASLRTDDRLSLIHI